jgi:hypothetical protein
MVDTASEHRLVEEPGLPAQIVGRRAFDRDREVEKFVVRAKDRRGSSPAERREDPVATARERRWVRRGLGRRFGPVVLFFSEPSEQ